jgi:hypothetical protein
MKTVEDALEGGHARAARHADHRRGSVVHAEFAERSHEFDRLALFQELVDIGRRDAAGNKADEELDSFLSEGTDDIE